METGLQLPTDHLVTPGASPRADRFDFMLPTVAAREPEIVAAYIAQLARYSGQEVLPLTFRGSRDFTHAFAVERESSFLSVVETVEAALRDEGAETATNASPAAFSSVPPPDAHLLSPECLLHLIVTPSSRGATLVYHAGAFDPATIRRLAGHLCTILAHVAISPKTPIGMLPLLPHEEARSVRAAGEGALRPYAIVPLHARIEKHAAETPDKIAVRFRDQTLTYAALNAHANRLAHYLRSHGIAEESRVMVSLEPGLEIAVALLAIHKAGGVYVPLEPTYPPARIQTILEDTAPALVVSSAKLVEKLPLAGFPAFELDLGGEALRRFRKTTLSFLSHATKSHTCIIHLVPPVSPKG